MSAPRDMADVAQAWEARAKTAEARIAELEAELEQARKERDIWCDAEATARKERDEAQSLANTEADYATEEGRMRVEAEAALAAAWEALERIAANNSRSRPREIARGALAGKGQA